MVVTALVQAERGAEVRRTQPRECNVKMQIFNDTLASLAMDVKSRDDQTGSNRKNPARLYPSRRATRTDA